MAPSWDGVYPVTISEVKPGRSFRGMKHADGHNSHYTYVTGRKGAPSISPGGEESRKVVVANEI